jgi:hypothetical protein
MDTESRSSENPFFKNGDRMDYTGFRQETAAWLEEYSHQWFCTLTCRSYYSIRQRDAHLSRWRAELQRELGTEDFNFVAIPEHGSTGHDYHFHVLVGGLSDCSSKQRLAWMKRWRELSGDALIEPYLPTKGGIQYILKNATPDSMDSWVLDLSAHTRMQSSFSKSKRQKSVETD